MYVQTLVGPTKLNEQIRFLRLTRGKKKTAAVPQGRGTQKGFQLLHIWPMEGYQLIPINLQSCENLYQIKGSHFYSWTCIMKTKTWKNPKSNQRKNTNDKKKSATFHRILGMKHRTCHRGSDRRPPLLVVAWREDQVIFDRAVEVAYTSN